MSFFYDLNKKLDSIRATPEVTHKQLNERDEGKPGKNFAKIAKDAGERYGSKEAGERVAGAVRNKLKAQGKLEEEGFPRIQAAIQKYTQPGVNKLAKLGREGASKAKMAATRKEFNQYDNKEVDEGVMDTVKSVGKKVASGINKLVGHGSDEEMRKDLQRKSGAPVTGKKPEQKTTEAAKWRDPKYKDKLYTQEPGDSDEYDSIGYGYDFPERPKNDPGAKRRMGGVGSEFDRTDPLVKGQGIGRSGIKNNMNTAGKRKGMPSRDQISSLKGSIKDASGTHAEPNLPEAGAPMTAKQKSFAKLAPPANKITFADKIAGAKKEVDEMLGDVAAEAMKAALGKSKQPVRGMEESAGGFTQADWDKVARKKRHLMMLNPNLEPEDAEQIAAEKLGYDYEEVLAWIEGNQNMEEAVKERSKGTAFDMSTPRAAAPKVGSVERGHKHDIKHTATGRMVTRRVDDQGNSVGADDDGSASGEKRGRGRPKGTKGAIGAKGPSGRSKLMTKEGDVDVTDQGEYDQEGDMAKDDIKTIVRHAQALSKVLGDDDNLPEWVQSKLAKIEGMMISIDEYMQNQTGDDGEEPIAEKAVSKQQQKFMGMAHAMQKGEKVKGASKELKKVAKTMKPKDTEDFAKTKHKGLPDKVKSKKKEEEVDESTTSGSVATSTANADSKGGVFGKGIYDSMNRELENMIAESMSINMSDSTEGNKSLTVTATDDDAMKLAMMLKSAGLGGQGRELQSDESCSTCGMPDCGCGDVQEAVDENAPDWPTNTEKADSNFGYSGGLNKPKTDVAGDGQTTIPNTAVHTQDEDALRRMMEMAGLAEAAKPDFLDLDKDKNKDEPMKDAADDMNEEDTVEESIRRMMEIAGVKKKPVDEEKTEEGNLFTKGLKDDDVKIGDKIPGTNAIKKKDIDESIFALTNQWKAYKG